MRGSRTARGADGRLRGMAHEHVDVLVIGAGLSGIDAVVRLRERLPDLTIAVLEARDAIGGTWDLFRYPGVRSDSDMLTLGYPFRPWNDAGLADGPSILRYVEETAREYGVDRLIRFGHRVERAEWCGDDARWTVHARRADTGDPVILTCSFLFCATGYYRYDEGYTPALPGIERFTGPVVHPQQWPSDLDWAGRRVVVVGSGATAVTLLPALAQTAAHVTMLQRSPTYVLSMPSRDPWGNRLRAWLGPRRAYPLLRWRSILLTQASFRLSRRAPALMRSLLRRGAAAQLPDGYDVDRHFAPRYDPWDQRLCLAPDGDLYRAIGSGRASVVTDEIDSFTAGGIRVRSGEEIPADVVVTATGLNLLALGGISLVVDGREVDLAESVAYKGMMLSGVPNLALALGYTNASWTLKCDLVSRYVARLLDHMRRNGFDTVTPLTPPDARRLPLIDLTAGYVRRGLAAMPTQGVRWPWRLHQSYPRDLVLLGLGRVDDEGVRFGRARTRRDSDHAVGSAV